MADSDVGAQDAVLRGHAFAFTVPLRTSRAPTRKKTDSPSSLAEYNRWERPRPQDAHDGDVISANYLQNPLRCGPGSMLRGGVIVYSSASTTTVERPCEE